MREGFVEWRLGRTWYRVAGDGHATPLLCLHGGPGSTHNYFAPLEGLGDERPVVLYDQIGCGASDRPEDVEWNVDVFLEELDALRDELALDRVHLLGTSWGGMLALEHAFRRQETLASLVLSSTLASAEQWAAEVKRLRDATGIEDDAEADLVVAERHVHRRVDQQFMERWKQQLGTPVYHAMWGRYEWTVTGALRGWDVRHRLGEIHVPTLVLRGGHDLSTPAVTQTLLDGIPHARSAVFDESSHMPVLEETDAYLDTVRAFVRANDP